VSAIDRDQQPDRSPHSRACLGEHVLLCFDRDRQLLTYPQCEHPIRMAEGIALLVKGLAAEPERILCLVGACDGHR
jgi:hypothetical protein